MNMNSTLFSIQEAVNAGGFFSVSGVGGKTESQASTSAVARANLATSGALKHNPGLRCKWSDREQEILQQALSKYSFETPLCRYAKIASQLQGKSTRDVALRCRWMSKKESTETREKDDNLRKSKDKKVLVTDPSAKSSSHLGRHHPYLSMLPLDNGFEISSKDINIPLGRLIWTNDKMLKKLYGNLSNSQVQDNRLLCLAGNNLAKTLTYIYGMPKDMRRMPPFRARINVELTDCILPMRADFVNTNIERDARILEEFGFSHLVEE